VSVESEEGVGSKFNIIFKAGTYQSDAVDEVGGQINIQGPNEVGGQINIQGPNEQNLSF